MAELNNTSTVRFELFVSHGTATVLVCQSVPQKKKKKAPIPKQNAKPIAFGNREM